MKDKDGDKMECPECGRPLIYEDDSFDHAFGTQIIQYYYCENCNYQIDAGELEEDYEE